VSELSLVEKNLDFWVERLRQGKHLRTMLFGQGPVSFAKDVRQIITRQERRDTASERIERRVRGDISWPVHPPRLFDSILDSTRYSSWLAWCGWVGVGAGVVVVVVVVGCGGDVEENGRFTWCIVPVKCSQ